MLTAGNQPFTWVRRVKSFACFTYRIYPFDIALFPWLRLLLGIHACWRLSNKYKKKSVLKFRMFLLMCPGSVTPDTWAETFEILERINSMRETNESFDSCNSCKRLVSSRLHELHESKLSFVSRIKFIHSKLSIFISAHVSGVIECLGKCLANLTPRDSQMWPMRQNSRLWMSCCETDIHICESLVCWRCVCEPKMK